MKAIEANGLVRRFGDLAAVDGVSFEVEQGEIFGFLGPNGAGPTIDVLSINLRRPTLEDVFIKLTGHAIREQEGTEKDRMRLRSRMWRRSRR